MVKKKKKRKQADNGVRRGSSLVQRQHTQPSPGTRLNPNPRDMAAQRKHPQERSEIRNRGKRDSAQWGSQRDGAAFISYEYLGDSEMQRQQASSSALIWNSVLTTRQEDGVIVFQSVLQMVNGFSWVRKTQHATCLFVMCVFTVSYTPSTKLKGGGVNVINFLGNINSEGVDTWMITTFWFFPKILIRLNVELTVFWQEPNWYGF